MTEITLRTVSVTDPQAQECLTAYYDELSSRFGKVFSPGIDPDPACYDPPKGIFLLAERDGRCLGCVGLRPDGENGEVKRLWIAPDARGLGLSRRLMAAVERAARDFGYTCLRLDTSRHLAEAIALYRRDGWIEIPRYNDNPYADFFFEKRL